MIPLKYLELPQDALLEKPRSARDTLEYIGIPRKPYEDSSGYLTMIPLDTSREYLGNLEIHP